MIYKAENVDTDKAIEYLNSCIELDVQNELREKNEVIEYHRGYRDGIFLAKSMFECANFEKDEKVGDE